MVYSLTYRRPAHVTQLSIDGSEKPKSLTDSFDSGRASIPAGIPDALSFDRVIAGGTCPVS